MLKCWAPLLLLLLLCGTASAVTTLTPAGGPVHLLPGQTLDLDLLLDTDDPVGALNVELFGSGGLTIDQCSDLGGVHTLVCTPISGGFVANASDFVSGIADGTPLVRLRLTASSVGGELVLGSFASSNVTLCPGGYALCVFEGIASPLGGDPTRAVVVPEPATWLLVWIGFLALVIARRRTRRPALSRSR